MSQVEEMVLVPASRESTISKQLMMMKMILKLALKNGYNEQFQMKLNNKTFGTDMLPYLKFALKNRDKKLSHLQDFISLLKSAKVTQDEVTNPFLKEKLNESIKVDADDVDMNDGKEEIEQKKVKPGFKSPRSWTVERKTKPSKSNQGRKEKETKRPEEAKVKKHETENEAFNEKLKIEKTRKRKNLNTDIDEIPNKRTKGSGWVIFNGF